MRKIITVTLLLWSCVAAHAAGQTFKNANGQVVGRSTTNNAGTQYYDSMGRNTGRSVTTNTGTTYYDAKGQMTGRKSP
jgi:predicted secreted Zn-dependent protease